MSCFTEFYNVFQPKALRVTHQSENYEKQIKKSCTTLWVTLIIEKQIVKKNKI